MDMPITVPRASVAESVDDLKARDMVLCRFPEVDMVVGKAGRAETPTDPAPMDMIETMVNFRPRAFWPRRKLHAADARRQVADVLDALVGRGVVAPPADAAARNRLLDEATRPHWSRFDAVSREFAYHRNQELVRESAGISPTSLHPSDPAEARLVPRWRRHVEQVDAELLARAGADLHPAGDGPAPRTDDDRRRRRGRAPATAPRSSAMRRCAAISRPHRPAAGGTPPFAPSSSAPLIEPQPTLEAIQSELSRRFGSSVDPLAGRPRRAGRVRRRAGPGRADAGLDERLDHADPEPGGHALDRREHADRHPRAGPEPR